MNIDEVIAAFDNVLGNLGPIMADEMRTIAGDGLELVDRRITREGKKSDGSPFPDYSVGYKLEKKMAGKYRGIVDLTFTGDMWKNTGITNTQQSGDTTTVTVAGLDPFTREKMANNADLRGDFLTLSEKEIDILRKDSAERLFGTIDGYFQ
jgi:hypothetical protein